MRSLSNHRVLLAALALTVLAVLPAAAQNIPAGDDLWTTPNNGQTKFTFNKGEVEALCGLGADDTWDHTVALHGVPLAADFDTVVRRLDPAVFVNNTASTRVQFAKIHLASNLHRTPCGELYFDAVLSSLGPQPITKMTIRRTSAAGGVFFAKLALNVEIQATQADGTYLGSIFHTVTLDDVPGGTAWSYGGPQVWRPGMTPTNDCLDVLREKLLGYPADSDHFYFISNLIAAGQCRPKG